MYLSFCFSKGLRIPTGGISERRPIGATVHLVRDVLCLEHRFLVVTIPWRILPRASERLEPRNPKLRTALNASMHTLSDNGVLLMLRLNRGWFDNNFDLSGP